ncbi:hypothetical protein GQ457_05G027380 [Hibiscus cannabinus]
MGEDVGHYGHSYKVNKELAKKFGDLRNSHWWTWWCWTSTRGRLESYFQSTPGIQMAEIISENPIIRFEHVLLYNLKERIPGEDYVCTLEEAEMVRPGEHVVQAAKTLVNKGYDPQIPLDYFRGGDLEIEISISSIESLAMEVGQVKGNFVDEKYHIRVKRKSLQAVLEECMRDIESLSNCKDGTDDDNEDDADKDAVNPQVEVRDVDTLIDEEVVEVLFNYFCSFVCS